MGIEDRAIATHAPRSAARSRPAAAARAVVQRDGGAPEEAALDRLDRRGLRIDASREKLGALVSRQAQACAFLVVAHPSSPVLQHMAWLGQCSRLCVTVEHLSVAEQVLSTHAVAPFLAIVDIDIFDTLSTAVDRMIAFRKRTPDVAVVIASTEMSRHDFSVERAPVADVSLKLPVPRAALGLGLGVALTNMASRPAFDFSL